MIRDDTIREIVAREMEAQREQIQSGVKSAVAEALESFGFEASDKKETQADFRHLRRWRKSTERIEAVGWSVAIGTIVSGVLGALWLGIKTAIGK